MRLCRFPSLLILLAASSLAFSERAAESQSVPDRVMTDSAGREVSRVRALPDGTTETSRVTWAGQRKRSVLSERTDASGRIVHRTLERFDDKGRRSELRAVDVDIQGHERGSRKVFTYDQKGSPIEQTFPIE
jgi:hypothetical protein